MDEKQLQELYNSIVSKDSTYKDKVSFDLFKQKMSDKAYSNKIMSWLGEGNQQDETYKARAKAIQPTAGVQKFQSDVSAIPSIKIKETLPFVKEQIESITPELLSKQEEFVVPELRYKFGPLGFKFEESGFGTDYVKVTSPDGKNIEIPLDDNGNVRDTERLKNFLKYRSEAIPNISSLAKEYEGEKKKFNSKKEIDESITSFSKKQNEVMSKIIGTVKKRDAIEEQIDRLNEGTMESIVSILGAEPRSKEDYEKFTKEKQRKVLELVGQRDELNKEISKFANSKEYRSVESDRSALKKAVGSYTTMKAEQGNMPGAFWNGLLSGIGRITASYAGDFASGLARMMGENVGLQQKEIIDIAKAKGIKVPDNIDVKTEQGRKKFDEWFKTLPLDQREEMMDDANDKVAKLVKYGSIDEQTGLRRGGVSDIFRQIPKESLGDKSITTEYEDLAKSEFWAGSLLGLAESIPAMIGAPGPAGWAIRTANMFSLTKDYVEEEMAKDPEFENISESEKARIVLPYAIASAALESYGLRNIIASKGVLNNIIYRALNKSGAGATSKTFSEFVKNEVKSGLARGTLVITAGALAEAETGAAQRAVEIGIKEIYNASKNKEMFKNLPQTYYDIIKDVAYSGAQEAVGGLVIGTIPAAAAAYRKQGFLGMSDDQFNLFEAAANDPITEKAFIAELKSKVNSGEMLMSQAKEMLNDYRNSVGLFNSLPENLSTRGKKEAMNLLREKRELEKQIENKDEALVAPQKERIKNINDQLTKLSENAVQEQSTDAGVLRSEGPQVGLQEVVQGDEGAQVATGGTQAQVADQQPQVQITGLSISDPEVDTRITDEKQKGILSFAKKAVNSISSILPDIEFVVHDNTGSYTSALAQFSGKSSSSFDGTVGNFSYTKDGKVRIDIDLSTANKRAVAHEITHAVLYKKFNDNLELYNDFRTRLQGVISSMAPQDFVTDEGGISTVKDALINFVNNPIYNDQQKAEEFITELSAMMSVNEAKISTSGWNKIASFIGDFVSKLTNGKLNLFEDARTTRDVVDFFKSMSKSIAAGEDVSGLNLGAIGTMKQQQLSESERAAPSDAEAASQGLSVSIGSPSEVKSKASSGRATKFTKEPLPLSFVTDADKIDISSLINDIIAKKQTIWFWMADQLGRGNYYDELIGGEHYLDAGPSFALDPENRSKGILWASGVPIKSLQDNINKSDYIFFISGSPQKAKLYNKRVLDLHGKRVGDFNSFKDAINNFAGSESNQLSIIKNTLNSVESFDELAQSGKRKPYLLAIDKISSLKTAPDGSLKQLLESFNAFIDYDSLRDGFYRDNGFDQNDIMLVGKPTGIGGKSAHSTYQTDILGEVVGVPDKVIDAWSIMPESVRAAQKNIIGREESTKTLQTKVIAAEKGLTWDLASGEKVVTKASAKQIEETAKGIEDLIDTFIQSIGGYAKEDNVSTDSKRSITQKSNYARKKLQKLLGFDIGNLPSQTEEQKNIGKSLYKLLSLVGEGRNRIYSDGKELSDAYRQAKEDGSDPELVKNVEDVIGKKPEVVTKASAKQIEENVEPVIQKIKSASLEEDQGGTFNPDGTEYKGLGLVVTGVSSNTNQKALKAKDVSDFAETHARKIQDNENVKIGLFKFNGSNEVSIDLNVIVDEKYLDQALEFATMIGQNSIWNMRTNEPIYTGQSGKNPRSFNDEQFSEIAKGLVDGKIPDFVYEEGRPDITTKASAKATLITDKKMLSQMTEDNEGNFLFYHISPNKIAGKIDPKFFGRNLRTGRDERPGIGISMYYTRPDRADVSGQYRYVAAIPKEKVYPFNEDPLNLYDKAEVEFNKMFPGQAFDPNKQVAFISREAEKLGYQMTVAKWGDGLRAQTTKPLKADWYQRPKGNDIEINEKYKDFKANAKKKPEVVTKASAKQIEETAKALEEAAPDYSYSFGSNRQQRYYVYKTAGLVYHGGESKIKSFDASKIKGGVRGELGYGFYFGQSSKPLDYGSEVTFLDSNNLNLIDADKPSTDPNFLSKLEGYANSISDIDNKISKLEDLLSKSKNNTDQYKILSEMISLQRKQISLIENTNAVNYAKELLSIIKENPRESIRYLAVRGSQKQNVLFSEIMKGIGYDGMQVSDNWQLVVYPSDNIDQLIVDPNKFSAEAYHKAKEDGSNPKLVDAVDKLIGDKTEVVTKASAKQVSSKTLPGYDAAMAGVQGYVDKAKGRGDSKADIVRTAVDIIQSSPIYESANDVQREEMVREARKIAGASQKSSPSVNRLFGTAKDVRSITTTDYALLKKQIADINKGARDMKKAWLESSRELGKYVKDMAGKEYITSKQAAVVLKKFSGVNVLSQKSIDKFVDYMQMVFDNAEYAEKISSIRTMLPNARKNLGTKIGIADGLADGLARMLSINPLLIPETVLDTYQSVVKMMSERKAVLNLRDIQDVTQDVSDVLDAVESEQSSIPSLKDLFDDYADKVFNQDGSINFAETINKMVKNNNISQDTADIMKKYKSDIMPSPAAAEKTQAEIDAEKNVLANMISSSAVNADRLPTRDERELARKISQLIKNTKLERLSLDQLNNLLSVIDNINNGYVPHIAQMLAERMESTESGTKLSKVPALVKPNALKVAYAKIKSLLVNDSAMATLIKRNSLGYIDQVFGDYKTKTLFNSVLKGVAQAQAKFDSYVSQLNERVNKAENEVLKSHGYNHNKALMSKFKMMAYMLQNEYDSNPNNKQVNSAASYIKKTIDHILFNKSTFGERDAKMLQQILDDYSDQNTGQIDAAALYSSFNQAEKRAISEIRNINDDLTEKAVFTASVIRGEKINPLNNYVHLNVLHEFRPEESTTGPAFVQNFSNSLRPSTKAKSLIERTPGAKPLNFDVFASVSRGARFVYMDYHMTPSIRTARKTIAFAKKQMKENGSSRKEIEIINAIDESFETAVENVLVNNFSSSSFADDVINFMSKQGYRAVLGSIPRFAVELASNLSMVAFFPKDFSSGVGLSKLSYSTQGIDIMRNVGSTQTKRVFPSNTISGRLVDSQLLEQASGSKGGRAKGDVANKLTQIYNRSLKKYTNVVGLTADVLISTPDKLVIRPMWFGTFANEFKKISGFDADMDKIAENNEQYMMQNKEAIDAARDKADDRSVFIGATDNSFMGVLKGVSGKDQSVAVKLFNQFNGFMSRFMINEFTTARTAIHAAVGNGMISKREGVALLAGVTTRMTLYTMLGQMLSNAMVGMFVDDEEEDEKSFDKKVQQSLASTMTSLLLGRDFGNLTRGAISYGVESMNEKYLDFLREGEYDPYKDAIQYSFIPPERKGQGRQFEDLITNLMGPLGPSAKTGSLMYKTYFGAEKKEEDAIQRQEDVKNTRIPLEVFGNLGMVPLYKDIRKIVLKEMYKGLNDEKPKESKSNSKKYLKENHPDLYKEFYGKSGNEQEAERIKKEVAREKKRILDELR